MRLSVSIVLYSLLSSSLVWAEQANGWTVGAGMVSVKPQSNGPFPVIQASEQNLMLLPNLSYRWQQWSLSSEGLGWQRPLSASAEARLRLGYPRSEFSISDQRGWFRYGADAQINYGNGLSATLGVNAAGVSYDITQGLNDRAGQWQQSVGFSAPLFIADNSDAIVLGNVGYRWHNAGYRFHQLSLAEPIDAELIETEEFSRLSVGAFSVWSPTAKLTLLASIDVTLADTANPLLTTEQQEHPLSVFVLFSYFLGKAG